MKRKDFLPSSAAALAAVWLFASAAAAQPAPTVQPSEPAPTAQPLQPSQSAQAAQSVQPPQPAPSAQPLQPPPTAQPLQPSQSAQAAQSMQPPQPSQSAQAAQSVQPPQPAPMAQAMQPSQSTQPALSAPAQTAAAPQPSQPTQPPQPAEPAKPRKPALYGDACASDLEKFCVGVQPSASRQRCLDAHEAEFAKPCQERRSELRELRAACESVIVSSCKYVPLFFDPMLKCLQEHETELGEPCKKLRASAQKPAHLIIPACQGDVKKLCKDVPLTSLDVSRCLQEHETELSVPCRGTGPEPEAATPKK